jgi:hypothetical protein
MCERGRERGRREKESGEVVIDATTGCGVVPRQCPLVLLVDLMHMIIIISFIKC